MIVQGVMVQEASYLSLGLRHLLQIPYVTGVREELSLDPLAPLKDGCRSIRASQ
jgi:hypothetical protein